MISFRSYDKSSQLHIQLVDNSIHYIKILIGLYSVSLRVCCSCKHLAGVGVLGAADAMMCLRLSL